jgi:Mandelate racemase / muconate lactonizing enzyme, N-terminal domain/Enolase C-terminal domain-like
MKIADIQIVPFRWRVDRYRAATPLPQTEVLQTVLKIVADDGLEGYYFGGGAHGDEEGLHEHSRQLILGRVKSMLVGQDPLDREKIWKWLWVMNAPEHVTGAIDMALWDLAGRQAGLPVHKLLGGAREKVKAYASTYPNMGPPENYAEHALACKRQGYRAYKIHPYYFWDPATGESVPGRPSHVEWDLRACRAVREAVGDDMVLMYDPAGTFPLSLSAINPSYAMSQRCIRPSATPLSAFFTVTSISRSAYNARSPGRSGSSPPIRIPSRISPSRSSSFATSVRLRLFGAAPRSRSRLRSYSARCCSYSARFPFAYSAVRDPGSASCRSSVARSIFCSSFLIAASTASTCSAYRRLASLALDASVNARWISSSSSIAASSAPQMCRSRGSAGTAGIGHRSAESGSPSLRTM